MKLIYLASPYSSKSLKEQRQRYKDVTSVAAKLTLETGYAFFLPITQSHQLVKEIPELGGTFANWKDIDLYAVEKSDELWVVMLKGWENSIGVREEINHAMDLGKPILYFDANGEQQ